MTLLITPEGYAFPDPDAIETDHNLLHRAWLRPAVSTEAPLPPLPERGAYQDRDLAFFSDGGA